MQAPTTPAASTPVNASSQARSFSNNYYYYYYSYCCHSFSYYYYYHGFSPTIIFSSSHLLPLLTLSSLPSSSHTLLPPSYVTVRTQLHCRPYLNIRLHLDQQPVRLARSGPLTATVFGSETVFSQSATRPCALLHH